MIRKVLKKERNTGKLECVAAEGMQDGDAKKQKMGSIQLIG
jgi:hypothetical protein